MKRGNFIKLSSAVGVLIGTSGWAFTSMFNSENKSNMKLNIKLKQEQHGVSLFGGSLHENKPLSGEPLFFFS